MQHLGFIRESVITGKVLCVFGQNGVYTKKPWIVNCYLQHGKNKLLVLPTWKVLQLCLW